MKYIAIVAILAALLVSCGGSQALVKPTAAVVSPVPTVEPDDPCSDAAINTYADAIDEQLTTFEAQTAVTGAAPRASMGTPLQKLVDIQQETRRIAAPECLADFHARVVAMMGLYRTAYETFAAQGNQHKIAVSLEEGAAELQAAHEGVAFIRKGQIPPDAPPTPVVTPGQGVING